MQVCKGNGVSAGIAMGRLLIRKKEERSLNEITTLSAPEEQVRFEEAKAVAIEQLQALFAKESQAFGEEAAMIFEVHSMLLEDPDYNDSILFKIQEEAATAEYAVACTAEEMAALFLSLDDEFMRERDADMMDYSERILKILEGSVEGDAFGEEPFIAVADDFSPSETVQFDRSKLLSLVTVGGSGNSHTAILARTIGIPAIVSTKIQLLDEYNGKFAIVDGTTGTLYIEPDEETLQEMTHLKEEEEARKQALLAMRGTETLTAAGRKIHLYSNIGGVSDVSNVLENDSEGIGLLRSEFLYLGSSDYPTEEAQFDAYKTVLSQMEGRRVVIRTLDIGADKQADYFQLPKEENPAMGLRAIRICLTRKEVFRTQLRALYRASAYGRLAIMFPMIISVEELLRIKEMVEEVKQELKAQGHAMGEVELGIMIETPAAAVISDLLAPHVDFFSIGSNDLSQYTLAIDRQNESLKEFFDPHHEAILRLMELTVKNAHAHGAWCGICGELGADLELTKRFVDMGMDEISVSPRYTLELRKKISEC